jgi:hypothetical protein
MDQLIFTVKDIKAEMFGRPIFQNSTGEALRAFQDEAQNPDSMLCKHPEDFHLYRIGTYDQGTGQINPVDPVHICGASDFAANPPQLHASNE